MVFDLEREGRVAVWLLSVSEMDDERRRAYRRFLAAPELERVERFALRRPADEFLAARALLRTRLALHTGVPELAWRFAENEHGWLHVDEPEEFRGVRFNLSHTSGLVACALCATHAVGVDVENTTRAVDFAGLAASSFAPREAEDVRSRPPEHAAATFFSYWTLKEAYVKARGVGLSLPLDSFWFDLAVEPPVLHCTSRSVDDASQWQFRQSSPTNEHRLALAVRVGECVHLDVDVRWADEASFARSL